MKTLAIEQETPRATAEQFKLHLKAEAVRAWELVQAGVFREVYEETGLQVQPTRIVGVYSGRGFSFTYPNGDQINVVSTWFDCRIVGGQLQADGVESLEVRFFAPDALPLLLPRHVRRIQDTLAGREEAMF